MTLLLDNTVLSNFALVERINLLPDALGNQIATTSQVINEYQNGVAKGILPATSWDWLEIIELSQEEMSLRPLEASKCWGSFLFSCCHPKKRPYSDRRP